MERKIIVYQKFSIIWPGIVAGPRAVRGRRLDVTLRSVAVVASFYFSCNAEIHKLFAVPTRHTVLTFGHALRFRKLDRSGWRVPLFRAPTFLPGKITALQSECI
jgi:hypothetical protein